MRSSRRLERWCLERLRNGPTVVEPFGLERLTVFVPSFGRPEFILRQLVFWSGTAAHLLILDGSPDPIPESVREAVDATDGRRMPGRIEFQSERTAPLVHGLLNGLGCGLTDLATSVEQHRILLRGFLDQWSGVAGRDVDRLSIT